MNDIDAHDLINSEAFKNYISTRRKLSAFISGSIIIAYFGFILMVAFYPEVLGRTLGDNVISIGIYAGLLLLLFSYILTLLYVRLSNGKTADLQKELHELVKGNKQ
ncbi:MAG: DUF485 domain-containing protein [Micavibrio aeruginosavorus]|uniref:DUF485 domain-containing protein n=1 Tax=Micavibrio aeruginosavorus TaxID=349221 RepID=A0A2W5FP70_9BACT|nr:MAG: DUF485 domain-containing protein [Micavibrio aeruginosavorus]